jgi:DNA-binding MarR family transcriptional regulator
MSAFNPRHRDTLSGQITIAFYRIAQAIESLLRQRGQAMSLSPAQIQALLFLKYARPGVRTIGGLAQRLGVTYATSSGVADALERKELIRRVPLPEDQRVVSLRLTAEGEGKAQRLEDVLDEIESAVNTLSEPEKDALLHATQIIVSHLQQRGHIKVYEMCWGCQFFQKNAHPERPDAPHHCRFIDAPLPEPDTYLECPDFIPAKA